MTYLVEIRKNDLEWQKRRKQAKTQAVVNAVTTSCNKSGQYKTWTVDNCGLNTRGAPPPHPSPSQGLNITTMLSIKTGPIITTLSAKFICHFRNDIKGNSALMYPPILLILDRYQWEVIKSVGMFGRTCLIKGLTILSWLIQTALRFLMIMAEH